MGLQQYVVAFVTFTNNIVIPFLLGIAFLFLVVNAIRFFVIGGANADSKEQARALAVYGVGAFVLIMIFWGIINILTSSLGLQALVDNKTRCSDYDPNCVQIVVMSNIGGGGFGSPGGDLGPTPGATLPGVDTPPSQPGSPGGFVTPSMDTPPTTLPGITGGDYSRVGESILTTLKTPAGRPTFLSDEFSNVAAGNIPDDSRIQTVVAFVQANITSLSELDQTISETNEIRVAQNEQPIALTEVPAADPVYVQQLETYHTNSEQNQAELATHYQSIGLTPTQTTERINQDMDQLYNTDLTLEQRLENAFTIYNDLTGTQTGNIAREIVLEQFVASVNAEIETSVLKQNPESLNQGQTITIEDITG